MSEAVIIRIYRWGEDEEEPVFSFFPEENGDDDGGRDYVLPAGYLVDSEEDTPYIRGEESSCILHSHNGLPVLVDEKKKRAFLLSRDRKIERFREKAGLTRGDLAVALGTSQLEVYRWETYEEEPGTALLGRIARILGCKTEDLT